MSLLNAQIIGSGPNLVLIHGLFGSLENLNMVAKPLSADFTVLSVDVTNHGASPHQDTMSYQQMAKDVVATMDNCGMEEATVLGHSMGGKIAMQLALSYPDKVTKLVVADISPVNYLASHLQIIEGMKTLPLDQISNRKQADAHLSSYVDLLSTRQFLLRNLDLTTTPPSWKCNLTAIANNYDNLIAFPEITGSFNGPTLFIKGGNSDYINASHREKIVTLFPQSKAKIIQGTGHWLHAEKPSIFNKIVSDFIDQN